MNYQNRKKLTKANMIKQEKRRYIHLWVSSRSKIVPHWRKHPSLGPNRGSRQCWIRCLSATINPTIQTTAINIIRNSTSSIARVYFNREPTRHFWCSNPNNDVFFPNWHSLRSQNKYSNVRSWLIDWFQLLLLIKSYSKRRQKWLDDLPKYELINTTKDTDQHNVTFTNNKCIRSKSLLILFRWYSATSMIHFRLSSFSSFQSIPVPLTQYFRN